jgi:hypothetical protein
VKFRRQSNQKIRVFVSNEESPAEHTGVTKQELT